MRATARRAHSHATDAPAPLCVAAAAAATANSPLTVPDEVEQGGGGCPIKGSNNIRHAPADEGPRPDDNLDTTRASTTIPQRAVSNVAISSPQMFWNALVRKDKADKDETDMDTVVAVHNAMNEATWSKILEQVREGPPEPVRFPKPQDLSPQSSSTVYVFGTVARSHDWVGPRGRGAEVCH